MYKAVLLLLVGVVCWEAQAWTMVEYREGVFKGYCESKMFALPKIKTSQAIQMPGKCATVSCALNGDIHYTGCSPVIVPPSCYIGEGSLSEPYPKCCHDIMCPEEV